MDRNKLTEEHVKNIFEPINEDYEWVQYNSDLRLIHHIDSDMYQLESLLDCIPIDYNVDDVLSDPEIQELIETVNDYNEVIPSVVTYQDLEDLNEDELQIRCEEDEELFDELNGTYINKYLVNGIAMRLWPAYYFKCIQYLTPKLELSNF